MNKFLNIILITLVLSSCAQFSTAYTWLAANNNSPVPANAVHAGNDQGGSPYYVGRASYNDEVLTVKISPVLRSAWIPYFGQEIAISNFEYLIGTCFSWEYSYSGVLPNGAVTTGNAGNEPIYVGRTWHGNSLLPGKIVRSHGKIFVPYGGLEHAYSTFDYLVCR